MRFLIFAVFAALYAFVIYIFGQTLKERYNVPETGLIIFAVFFGVSWSLLQTFRDHTPPKA